MTRLVSARTPLLMFTLALAAPQAQAQAPAPVEETGQTSCYDAHGALISCDGTGLDGELRPGVAWPSPRFTDNGDGTVTDELSRLIWLKDADCFGIQHWGAAVSVVRSLGSGLCGLSDSSVAGDWRLPSVKELQSLLAYGYAVPALASASGLAKWQEGDPFSKVRWSTTSLHGGYWSSTSYVQSPNAAWIVSFYTGNVWPDYKENQPPYGSAVSHYVWPVRDGDPEPDNEPPSVSCVGGEICNDVGLCSATVACQGIGTCVDPDDDATTLTCKPAPPYAVGSTDATVTCDDGQGGATSAQCVTVVKDCEPPVCTAPPPIKLKRGHGHRHGYQFRREHDDTEDWLALARATDNCSVKSFTSDAPAVFPGGVTVVTWTATDASGNARTCSSTVTIESHHHPKPKPHPKPCPKKH